MEKDTIVPNWTCRATCLQRTGRGASSDGPYQKRTSVSFCLACFLAGLVGHVFLEEQVAPPAVSARFFLQGCFCFLWILRVVGENSNNERRFGMRCSTTLLDLLKVAKYFVCGCVKI
ncbi:hypothetical protein CDAR_5651 [Caerostris darwini]|uniref:Uncharacterized protein n=1 Tax=Caerostris darwini TaxID=1538125 RepID=A0AAV4VH20_9ARAC|nr:hypothetical protein CDAR_5651 [Caerostris darwini]